MSDHPIYNCHIHTFTYNDAPPYFLKFKLGDIPGYLVSGLTRHKWFIRSLIKVLGDGDGLLERLLRLVETGDLGSQESVFKEIQKQYPLGTVFVALPMDLKFMGVGDPKESLDQQHADLLKLASGSNGTLIPFYAADPRRDDLVEKVRNNLSWKKFRGIKIYPNLGYRPDDERLMEIYGICEKGGFPVIAHCASGGVWKYGMTESERRCFGNPHNYSGILKKYPKLKLCLAHFGGIEEWDKHLKGRSGKDNEKTWVELIYDMISGGEYPNLYTDISYAVFTPRLQGLYIDMVDYLKVMLANRRVRSHVLFGSDYYMVKQERMSEKEVSIMLRSRLGEELFFQIAHRNPSKFLKLNK